MQKLWIGTAMETIAQDIHYALRMLPRNPGFTAVSVLTLAAGISVITCVFGLSNAFFLRPLPFKDPAQLVHVWQTDANVSWDTARVSVPNYNDWREQNTVFEDLGGYFYTTYTLTTSSANRKVLATLLTPNLFDVLGAKPVLGRTFAQEEGQAGPGTNVRTGGGPSRPGRRGGAQLPLLAEPVRWIRRSAVRSVRAEIQSIDPDQPITTIRTMNQVITTWLGAWFMGIGGISALGLGALLLAAMGIYGVIAYSVSRRTHEVGIRVALGAQRPDILKLVVGWGMMLALLGVALGLVAALALTRFLASLLFGVTAADPLTFAGVSLLLVAVALLPCYFPARRATRVDPMVALRDE